MMNENVIPGIHTDEPVPLALAEPLDNTIVPHFYFRMPRGPFMA